MGSCDEGKSRASGAYGPEYTAVKDQMIYLVGEDHEEEKLL